MIVLLQPLWWRCVDCVIHHERDVREKKHYICVARTSSKKRDCDTWSLLLLAVTVWSFAHMPLGLFRSQQYNGLDWVLITNTCRKKRIKFQKVVQRASLFARYRKETLNIQKPLLEQACTHFKSKPSSIISSIALHLVVWTIVCFLGAF